MVTSGRGGAGGGPSLELVRLDSATWLIRDRSRSETDPWHLVARIVAMDGEGVHVAWKHPSHHPTRYSSAQAVWEDLTHSAEPPSSGTRPVPIPHLPPLKRR